MYRSEQWYRELRDKKLKTPLFIPSYRRPGAPIFTKSKLKDIMLPDWTFVFIRDNKEEYESYKHLQHMVTLVPLPKDVCDINTTKESMVQFGLEQNYTNVFIFDDRVLDVRTLAPRVTRNGKEVMGIAPFSTPYGSLLLWEFLQNCFPTTVSMPAPAGNSWFPENINRDFTVNKPGGSWVCYCLNIQDVCQYDIHMGTWDTHGVEDMYLLYQVMKAGLPSRVFTDLEFKEVYPEQMAALSERTGGNATSPLPRNERIKQGKVTFCHNVLGIEVGQKNPEVSFRSSDSEGFTMRFNFARYWSRYYEEHKVK